MNCPFSSIVCLQAGLDRDAPPRTLQKMSQKSDSFAWNFCELYVIEKTQNAFGEFRAANVSTFARPLMTVGRPIQTLFDLSIPMSSRDDRITSQAWACGRRPIVKSTLRPGSAIRAI